MPVAGHPAPVATRRTRRAKGAAPVSAGGEPPTGITSGPGVAAASATPSWSLWGDVET